MVKSCFLLIWIVLALQLLTGCNSGINEFTKSGRLPQIFPDYTSIIVPANIAPLNFNINEKGSEYLVEIYSKSGDKITIRQTSPEIKIPIKSWHNLLNSNKGNSLNIDIYSKQEKWIKYTTITDTIAADEIDSHLVYRLIGIVYTYYGKLGIYQRNLENFNQSVILENSYDKNNPCINCHSFSNNNPEKMSLHVRRFDAGTIIYNDGKFSKFNTKTDYTMSPAAYTSWHPNGDLIAFSTNQITVNYTSFPEKIVEVWDKASDLVVYNVKTNTITTSPKICTQSRENLPSWSPDGKYLYFISTPKANEDGSNWIDGKYDLLRISFDPGKMTWGEVDTLLTSKQTGKGISFPVPSPDGRYILFSMIDHGYFSIFDKNSDLYLFDLETKQYHRLDNINSPCTDSFHAWSKNGRWVVFSSKRIDGICTHPYFAYFDKDGNFHKPFVLPQEDPLFYKNFIWNFNLPVLVDGKVDINANEFRDFLSTKPDKVSFDKSVDVDALSGATWLKSNN
jgi:hypothetical protein